MKDPRDEDTRRRWRAATRHVFELSFRLRGIEITFRTESPGDLNRRQSLDDGQWGLTVRTQPN